MMPMKDASSDIKSAASARNETTRPSALATGFRLMITAPPKINISKAKIQKRNGDIVQATDEHRSNTDVKFESEKSVIICVNLWLLFLIVPFQNDSVHHAADFEQFVFVMHHVLASETGDSVIFSQKDCLFGANFFAHAAENAADHVDIEFLGVFFDFGEAIGRRDFARNNFDRARWANEFAKLTGNTAHAPILVAHKRGRAPIIVRQAGVPFFLRILYCDPGSPEQHVFEMFDRDD